MHGLSNLILKLSKQTSHIKPTTSKHMDNLGEDFTNNLEAQVVQCVCCLVAVPCARLQLHVWPLVLAGLHRLPKTQPIDPSVLDVHCQANHHHRRLPRNDHRLNKDHLLQRKPNMEWNAWIVLRKSETLSFEWCTVAPTCGVEVHFTTTWTT